MTARWRSSPSPVRLAPRTKLAVWSADPNVDAIGACVGPRGQRVNNIVEELGGEKVDIIKYSEDPAEYIAAALSPADVISVTTLEEGKSCRVVVPDDQLSLAIGKEGQNARLAAKLTGYKIDIKPQSAPVEEELPQDEEGGLPGRRGSAGGTRRRERQRGISAAGGESSPAHAQRKGQSLCRRRSPCASVWAAGR